MSKKAKQRIALYIFTTIIIRVPAAYTIAHLTANVRWPHGTPWALSGSLLIAWVVSMLMTIVFYRMNFWRRKLGALGDDL